MSHPLWSFADIERAADMMVAKARNAPDISVEDAVRTVVFDMALIVNGPLTLDDFDPEHPATTASRFSEVPPGVSRSMLGNNPTFDEGPG